MVPVKRRSEYDVVGQAVWGYGAEAMGWDCEVVGRTRGRESEALRPDGLGLALILHCQIVLSSLWA